MDRFRLRLLLSLTLLLSLCLACVSEVDGERASTGECPEEECSEATPMGLRFVGNGFYDDEMLRLGPILVGGTFDVGVVTPDGADLPPFAYVVEESVLSAEPGEGTFGPTLDDGTPIYPLEEFLTLKANTVGETYLRIVEPETGVLMDRLLLETYELEEVEVVNAGDPDRDHLLAGCEQMVGVRLIAGDAGEVRAFDQTVSVRVDGANVREEPRFWDCILHDIPEGSTEVEFEITAAGGTYMRTMAVQSLEDEGLDACPEIRRD